ncbi:MAG: phage holin family protein [Hungatella sp.]|jgi:toxin secretion/phage lysis holin|nr:phage holin family protein [Hungatella sp.]
MKKIWNGIQPGISLAGRGFGWLFGKPDGLLCALAVFMAAEYLTGFLKDVVQKQWPCELGFKGIALKITVFVYVAIGNIIDTQLTGGRFMVRKMVIIFFLAMEGLAILNNGSSMGLPVPAKLQKLLLLLKEG